MTDDTKNGLQPISKPYLDAAEMELAEFVRRVATMDARRGCTELKRDAQDLLRKTGWAK